MRRWLLVLLGLAIQTSRLEAQNIGIYFDPQATSCSGTIAAGTAGRLYVLATPGPGNDGIVGAEFRITGLPAGWLVNVARNPASHIQIGDPFSAAGVNAAFPACQFGPLVPLFTIDLFATTAVTDHSLRIERHVPPHNPNLVCPILTLCGFNYPEICSTGGEAILNPTGPACAVAVAPTSWSRVKGLYGE